MADLLSLFGYNESDGTEKFIAVWARAPMIYNSATGGWEKAPITLTAGTKAEFRTFLDYAFMVNGVNPNYSFDGSVWSTSTNLADAPKGYFIENYNVRLYLGNITLPVLGTAYPSRVWRSDLPKNDAITWGLETGTNLAQTAGSGVVTSTGSLFKTRNIKVGNPFTITTGSNAGEYTVQSIDSETQITLTETLDNTQTGKSFWVGGNWFDVETDDGDTIKGFGKNSNELLIYKRNSVHRYSSRGQEQRQVKGIPGTTARRSIINIGDYTYHYHPSGIYRIGLPSGLLISNAIEDIIDGVTTANQSEVVGWKENEKILHQYLGDVTLRDGTSITNCVASYDTTAKSWSLRSYPFVIKAATTWLESNVPNVYLGDNASHVYKIDVGTDFSDDPIPFELEDQPRFPAGADAIVDFDRVKTFIDNGPDVQLFFKLYYKPTKKRNQWINDKDWQPMIGSQRGEKSEWEFPTGSRASGVALKFIESSTNESFLIEKYFIYYSNPALH